MRVVFIVNNLSVGGVQRIILDDCIEMQRLGHDVCVITLEKEISGNTLNLPSGIVHQLVLVKRTIDIHGFFGLFLALRKIKPHMVVTHMWLANNVGRVAAYFARVATILSFEHSIYDGLKTRKQFIIDWLLQSISTNVVAVSWSVKKSLLRHGIRDKNILVLHNAIDAKRFNTEFSPKYTRKDFGIPENSFIIISVGRLHKVKRIDETIRAVASISNCFLLIVGDGVEQNKLEAEAQKLLIREQVKFLGNRSDVEQLLRLADCLVLASSDREGFGLVILEAMACGVPIITSNFDAAREIITEGSNGLIFSSENELREMIKSVKNDNFLRNKLVTTGLEDVKKYNIIEHARQLLSLYKNS
jgi:glycosyltransferase involved in cell wall biosynthesis